MNKQKEIHTTKTQTKINNYIQSNNQAIKVSILHDESKNVRNILSELGNNVIAAVLIVMVMILATHPIPLGVGHIGISKALISHDLNLKKNISL